MAKSDKDNKQGKADSDGPAPNGLSGMFSKIKIKLPEAQKVDDGEDDWEMSPAELEDKARNEKAAKDTSGKDKVVEKSAERAALEPKQSAKAKKEAREALDNLLQGRNKAKVIIPAVALKSGAGDAVKKMLESRLARASTPPQVHVSIDSESSTIVGTDAPPPPINSDNDADLAKTSSGNVINTDAPVPPQLLSGAEEKSQLFSRVHDAPISTPLPIPVRKDSRYIEVIDVGDEDSLIDNQAPIPTPFSISSSPVKNKVAQSLKTSIAEERLFERTSSATEFVLVPSARKIQPTFVQVIDADEDDGNEHDSAEEKVEIEIESTARSTQMDDAEIDHDLLATVLPVVDRLGIQNLKGKSIIELREEFISGIESQHLRSLLNNSKVQAIFPHTDHNKISAFVAAIEHAKNGKELSKILIKNGVHIDKATINVIYAEKLMRAAVSDALDRINKGSKKLDKYNKQEKFQADKSKAVIAERNGLSVLVNYFQYKWDKILSYIASQPRIGSGFRDFAAMFLDAKMMGGNKRSVDEIIDPDAVRERAERARPVLSDQNVVSKTEESVNKDVDTKITKADIENNRLLASKLLALANEKLTICQKMQFIADGHGSLQSYDQLVKEFAVISDEIDGLEEKVILTADQESDFEYCQDRAEKILDTLVKHSKKPASVEPVKVDYLNTLVGLLKLLPRISQDKSVQADYILDNFSLEIEALNAAQQLPLLRTAVNNISDKEIPADSKEVLFIAIAKKIPSFAEQEAQLNAAVDQHPVIPPEHNSISLPPVSSQAVNALSDGSQPEQKQPLNVVVSQPVIPLADDNELEAPMLLSAFNKLPRPAINSTLAAKVDLSEPVRTTHIFSAAEVNNLQAAAVIAMAEEILDTVLTLTSRDLGPDAKNKIDQVREQSKRITVAMNELSQKTDLLPVEKYILEVYTGEANRLLNNVGLAPEQQDTGTKVLPLPHAMVKELQAKHPGLLFKYGEEAAPEKSFSRLLTEIVGENRAPELARLLYENADLRNSFIRDGKIDSDKFKKFVKKLDSGTLEVQLGEVGVSLPANSDRLNHLRNEVATYSQPVLLPIRHNLHEKDQIKIELELSQQARTKIETPELLFAIEDIKTKMPELLKLLVDARGLLKIVSEEEPRRDAWIDYRKIFSEIVEIYNRNSDLSMSTKAEYEEKLKSVDSKYMQEQIKNHYGPIIASLNKTESLLYQEMNSAEMVEMSELDNDKSKLEKKLAQNNSLLEHEISEIKFSIKSLEADIALLPEDIRISYAATKFRFASDRVRQPIIVPPVVTATDLDLLRESTRLLSNVREEVRAEILIDVFNNSDISGVIKLEQLKKIEKEWFINLPAKFNWITPKLERIMHETVDTVLRNNKASLQASERDLVEEAKIELPANSFEDKRSQEFSAILANIMGENRTSELALLLDENDELRNTFINDGTIDITKLGKFIKSLESVSLEKQLREVNVSLPPYSDRLNKLRNEVATYSQPVLIPIKRNPNQKQQIQTELELSNQKPFKIETPDLLAMIEGVNKKTPELLKSLRDARDLLKIISTEDDRREAWTGYRESYNNVFEVYDEISNLIISTKSQYAEKLRSTDSNHIHEKLKDHYLPIIASLNKAEILLYQEMNSAEMVEIRELYTDKFKLEKKLAENVSMSSDDIMEVKAAIKFVENSIVNLPEDIIADYAATRSRFSSDRIPQVRIVPPVVPGTDLDLLRETTRKLPFIPASLRGEYLIAMFGPENISKDKLTQLKKIESEWFSNLPENFSDITEEQMKVMRELVDLALGNTISPPMHLLEDEQALVEIDSPEDDEVVLDDESPVLPKTEAVKYYKSEYDPGMRKPIPDPTILRIGKYPDRGLAPEPNNIVNKLSADVFFQSLPIQESTWSDYLSESQVNIDHDLFSSTMAMLESMNDMRPRSPDFPTLFWDAMSEDKKLSVINTITDQAQLTRILHALRPEWRSQFLSLVPQSKFDEILRHSHNLGGYISELYKLGLEEFVNKIDPELVKSAVQIFVDLDVFDHIPAEVRPIIANMFVEDYLNQRVESADELARSITKLVRYGLFDQIQYAEKIFSEVIKNETDLYNALAELSVVEKAFFMSHISQSRLHEIAIYGSNANQMAAAFSLLPANSLNELISRMGEDWLIRLIGNVTSIESYVSLIESLPDDMRTKILFDESTQQIKINYRLINNIKNYDNLTRLLISLKDDNLKEVFLNQLKENSIDFINDIDFTDTYYRKIYIDFINRIPATGDISDEALADLLLDAKPEERKAIFNQHTKPSILKLLSYEEKDIVNLLKVLPSAKWRNDLSNDTNDARFKKKASNFNNITSLNKLKSYERAASRLMKTENTHIFFNAEEKNKQFYENFKADYVSQLEISIADLKKQFGYAGRLLNSKKYKEKLNDLQDVHAIKMKELLDMEASDKLFNKGIFIFDMEKIFSGAISYEDRLAAVSTIANIIKRDGNIQELQINLVKLDPAEIKILSQAFSERSVLNNLPQIKYLDIHCSDNCPLENMSDFLKSVKSEMYNLRAEKAEENQKKHLVIDNTKIKLAMRTVLSLSDHQKNIIESEAVNAISGHDVGSVDNLSACKSTAQAYKEIKDLFQISDSTYLGYTDYPVRFDDDTRKVCDSTLKFIENRNIQPVLSNAIVAGLTVKIPVNRQPDIIEALSPLSSPSSLSVNESPLSVSPTASLASTTHEYSDSDSSLESSLSSSPDDAFNYQTTDRGSPNKSPRAFSFHVTDQDRLRNEIINLCTEYDTKYKATFGQILQLDQLEMLAEIASSLHASFDTDIRINETLKSIHILNLTGLQAQINAENCGDVARWTADIIRNSVHIRELDLPYNNFSENEIKPIADVFAEAEPSARIKVLTLSRVNNDNPASEGVELIRPILENLKKANAKTAVTIANPYPLDKLRISGNFQTRVADALKKLSQDSGGLIKFDNHTNSMTGVTTLPVRGAAMFKGRGEMSHNRKDALPPLNQLPTGKKIK